MCRPAWMPLSPTRSWPAPSPPISMERLQGQPLSAFAPRAGLAQDRDRKGAPHPIKMPEQKGGRSPAALLSMDCRGTPHNGQQRLTTLRACVEMTSTCGGEFSPASGASSGQPCAVLCFSSSDQTTFQEQGGDAPGDRRIQPWRAESLLQHPSTRGRCLRRTAAHGSDEITQDCNLGGRSVSHSLARSAECTYPTGLAHPGEGQNGGPGRLHLVRAQPPRL